jgi:hypothetical protein
MTPPPLHSRPLIRVSQVSGAYRDIREDLLIEMAITLALDVEPVEIVVVIA